MKSERIRPYSKDWRFQKIQGKYPVISLSLKDVEGTDFQTAYDMLGSVISEEAGRYGFLLESDRLNPYEKDKLIRFSSQQLEAFDTASL